MQLSCVSFGIPQTLEEGWQKPVMGPIYQRPLHSSQPLLATQEKIFQPKQRH